MTALNEYNPASPLIMPSDDIKRQVDFQNTYGELKKSIGLEEDKHYTLILSKTDQRFTLEEWVACVTAIKTSLFSISPSVMAVADGSVFECGDYWTPKIKLGFDKFKSPQNLDKSFYYSILVIETDEFISNEDIEAAQAIAGSAVTDRTLDMIVCDRVSESSSTSIISHLTFEQSADGEKLDFEELVSNNVDITGVFLAVEQPVAVLTEDVPELYELPLYEEAVPMKWNQWKVSKTSIDETKAILILAKRINEDSYRYDTVSAEENSAHIVNFGVENLLTKKQWAEKLQSSEYTAVSEEI